MKCGSPGRELHYIYPDSRVLSCNFIILIIWVKYGTLKLRLPVFFFTSTNNHALIIKKKGCFIASLLLLFFCYSFKRFVVRCFNIHELTRIRISFHPMTSVSVGR